MNTDYKFLLKSFINPSILLLPLLERNRTKWDYERMVLFAVIPEEYWDKILTDTNTNEDFNWYRFSKHRKVSAYFLEKHLENFDLNFLLREKMVSIEFLETHYFDMENYTSSSFKQYKKMALSYLPFSLEFIEKNHDKFEEEDWQIFSTSPTITEEFWKKFKDKFSLELLSSNPNFSVEFWREHKDGFCLENYCKNPNLNISFIEEHGPVQFRLSYEAKYTEEQLEKYFKNKYHRLANNKYISPSFWIKHIQYVDWEAPFSIENMPTEEQIFEHRTAIHWGKFCENFKFSEKFIDKYWICFNIRDLSFNKFLPLSFWCERGWLFPCLLINSVNTSLKELKKYKIKKFHEQVSRNENFFVNTAKELLNDVFE